MQQDNSPIRVVYSQLRAQMNQEQKRKLQRLNDDRVRAWRAVFTVLNRQQQPVMANLMQQDFHREDADKKAIVEGLRREIEELTCSICMETAGGERGVYITSCSHVFCETCMQKYEQSGKRVCPLCRKELGCAYREVGSG